MRQASHREIESAISTNCGFRSAEQRRAKRRTARTTSAISTNCGFKSAELPTRRMPHRKPNVAPQDHVRHEVVHLRTPSRRSRPVHNEIRGMRDGISTAHICYYSRSVADGFDHSERRHGVLAIVRGSRLDGRLARVRSALFVKDRGAMHNVSEGALIAALTRPPIPDPTRPLISDPPKPLIPDPTVLPGIAPPTSRAPSPVRALLRPDVRGKFIFADDQKLFVCGVT